MRGFGIFLMVAASCLVAAGAARADEDWNCGGAKVIQIGMSQDDVLANCGAPSEKSVERWTYATDTVTTVLTFDQGKLIDIETESTE